MQYGNPLANPWYYLDNFEIVLRWVQTRYQDLLLPDEHDFIRQFLRAPQASKGLLVRMVMRKGQVFRSGRLRYAEIGSTADAIAPLVESLWVEANPPLTLDEVFGILLRNELSQLLGGRLHEAGVCKAGKSAQRLALAATSSEARTLQQWSDAGADASPSALCEPIYRLKVRDLCDRLRLMFFGNLHQDWTEFVLSDLGMFTYETVAFDPSSRAFRCREDIDAYLHLHECRQDLDRAASDVELQSLLERIPQHAYGNDWLEERRAKLLFRIGQSAERGKAWPIAQTCYARSTYPGARARRIRTLERSGQHKAARDLAQLALEHSRDAAEQQAVSRMMPRLQRLCGGAAARRTRHNKTQHLDLTLGAPSPPLRIEEEARQYLMRKDAPVFYVENALINALFGLLCWDAVFADVPGAFFHPFQQGPADLLHPRFHSRRAAAFQRHFDELETGEYKATIKRNFACKNGVLSPFVYWSGLPEELLDLALDCIPAAHLKRVFDRLLQDMRGNRSGLPDLIQFWPYEQRYRLIEVKGPGDRLQDNQSRWLDYFADHNIPVCVCFIKRPVSP